MPLIYPLIGEKQRSAMSSYDTKIRPNYLILSSL
jgi:hypothetical protein